MTKIWPKPATQAQGNKHTVAMGFDDKLSRSVKVMSNNNDPLQELRISK